MATQCVTKTTSKAAAVAATVTMADPAATIVTPRPPMDGTATTEKEFPRKFQVDLSKLINEPIAKRVLVLVLPPTEDLTEAPLCPCLFFKNHDAMVDELPALHAEMVGSDETLDKDDFFDEGVLNVLSLKYFDSEDPNQNGKTPVLVLLGKNDVILDPPSTNLMHFFHGHVELRHHAQTSPSLESQYRKASKIIKYDDGKRGAGKKKRRLEPKKLEPTRPLKKPCVTPAAQNKPSMPVPAAAAAKKSATLSVSKEQPRAINEPKDLSEASKKPAAVEAATEQAAKKPEADKEPTPMEIETEVTAASKELEKLSNDGGLILVEAQEGIVKASTSNKNPLPLEEIRASQGGHKMAALAAPEQEKSPAQKSLLMDASQQESEKPPAKNPAAAASKPAAKPVVRDIVPPAGRADKQEPQSQIAAKKQTNAVEKTAPRQEKQGHDVEMEEIETKNRKETETPEAPLHSTCSELPQPGSGEMDDDRAIGLKQVVANVEQSKETIAGGRNKQVQPSTKPPKVPGRGRPAGRNSTQKKGKGGNMRKRSPSPARALAQRVLTPEERKIPTFQEVKPLLEKAGYSFIAERSTTPRFCYLSYNDKRPEANSEGNDYTHSEEEFRKRLCSQGLGDLARHALSEEETAKVERWVRLAVVTSLPRAQKTLPEEIPDVHPSSTLRALGYNHNTHELPGLNNTKVTEENDVWLYLTHEGIPKECYFDNVKKQELLELELFLAFFKRNLFDPPFQTRRARRPSNASTGSTAKKPATRKQPAPKKVDAATSVQAETQSPNSEFVSPEHCDKAALADCNKSPASEASTLAGVERDIYAEMDKNDDDVEKLETCLKNLERSAKATDGKGIVLGPKGSHFQNNIAKTADLLESMIKSRMDHKRHSRMKGQPAALFICGPPGIGKTSGISFCCKRVLEGFTDPDGIWVGRDVEPVVVEVNCSKFAATGGNVQGEVLLKLWDACNGESGTLCNEASMKKMLTSNKSDTKKRLVILVLDEIDQLVNPNSESHIPKTNGEKLIQKLSKWTAWSDNDTLRFVLIGIGNTMNGPKYRRVKQFLEPEETITFQAYLSTDLENILRNRMEDASVVDPKALSFIAKKAASSNKGDARPAIELLAMALNDAKERVKNQTGVGKGLDFTRGEYIVKVRDVVKLNTDFTKLSQLIQDLSLHTKIVVCAAVELALKNDASGSEFMVTRRDLLDATRKAFYEKLGENFGFDVAEANAHISTLDDNGIAKIAMDDTIVFSHMPQELETAVKDSLGKEDFFGF